MLRVLFLLLPLAACATSQVVESPVVEKKSAQTEQELVIGQGTRESIVLDLNHHARFAKAPPGSLAVAKITRRRAEMREGPGTNFALSDRILEENNRVIVFDQHGVWSKILTTARWEIGWVHNQTLSPARPNKKEMTVDFSRFPTVLAVRPVNQGIAFASGDAVGFEEGLPKGRLFRVLQFSSDKTLIWLPETNSIVWIKGRDMQ